MFASSKTTILAVWLIEHSYNTSTVKQHTFVFTNMLKSILIHTKITRGFCRHKKKLLQPVITFKIKNYLLNILEDMHTFKIQQGE